MTDLSELSSAIEEVAAWRWWAHENDQVQLEFSSPQLARETSSDGIPMPVSPIALSLAKTHALGFLTRADAHEVPPDWPRQMAADSLDFDVVPPGLSFELFALNDRDCRARVFEIPHRIEWVVGPSTETARFELTFWAGNVGATVAADALRLTTHEGEIQLSDVGNMRKNWWKYWRAYWTLRGSVDALPYDPGCEITIPLK